MTDFKTPSHLVVTAARSVAARAPIGMYDKEARVEDAPAKFSATSLVVWCYARIGIALEDDLLALHAAGAHCLGSEVLEADLMFRTGKHDRFPVGQMRYGVGHVGICTGEGTVVHASPYIGCVHEDLLDAFLDMENGHYRGHRRIFAR